MDSSNFWKLDKIDKIGIALIFIVFAIYSTFSCFASESEVVEYDVVSNIAINPSQEVFVSNSSGASVGYIEIEPGYIYTLTTTNSNNALYCFSNDIPSVGGQCFDIGNYNVNNSISFTSSQYRYAYFDFRQSSLITLTRQPLEGMSGAVDNLSYYARF